VLDLQAELGHVADDFARQQQRAEQALLGVEVVRWHPVVVAAPSGRVLRGGGPAAGSIVVSKHHEGSTLVGLRCG
jgi:hypothetical protein